MNFMNKEDFLSHHGILGMKWGQRRWQNKDGTLTEEGKKRYAEATETIETYNKYKKAAARKKEIEDAEKPSATKSLKKATEELESYTNYREALSKAKSLNTVTDAQLAKASGHFKGASSTIDNVSNGIGKAWDNLHNAKYGHEDRSKDVSNLTNAELRQAIERIKLNQEYNKITMPSKTKGYDRTMAALAVLGSMATVTATGLSIAAGVKSLRKK